MSKGGGIPTKRRNAIRAYFDRVYSVDGWLIPCQLRIHPRCPEYMTMERTTIDHIIPRSRGGSRDSLANVQPACLPCNQLKGNGVHP